MSDWWGFMVIRLFEDAFPGVPRIGTVALCAWITWLIVSIVLHELGHGWAAIRCGDDTPRLLGHMTLDPIKHMGLVSLVLLALLGIAWGAMPINPSNFRRRYDDAIVAIAGPAVNVLIAIFCVIAVIVCDLTLPADKLPYAQTVLRIGSILNVTLALLNMVPIPPLDGWRVFGTFIPPLREHLYNPRSSLIGLIAFFVLGRYIIVPALAVAIFACIGVEHVVMALVGKPLPLSTPTSSP